jgi:hypothetical protein
MDIFDLLAEDLHRHLSQLDQLRHQYSCCCLMIGKRRSTSSGL